MQSLILQNETLVPLSGSEPHHSVPLTDGSVLLITRDGVCGRVNQRKLQLLTPVSSLRSEFELEETQPIEIVGVGIVNETRTVLLALSSGELLSYSFSYVYGVKDTSVTECNGCISEGVRCLKVSPNQQTVAVGTGIGTVSLFTTQWNPLHETDAVEQAQEWEAEELFWKYDSECYGVVAQKKGESCRRIILRKVGGELICELGTDPIKYRKETIIDPSVPLFKHYNPDWELGRSAAWFPNGSLVACSARNIKSGAGSVKFFLPNNGDEHGDSLELDSLEVLSISWTSGDNSAAGLSMELQRCAMAVAVKHANGTAAVRLYHRNNYHWYCAQQFPDLFVPSSIEWGTTDQMVLYCVQANNTLSSRTFRWNCVAHPTVGACATADGALLRVNHFQACITPPPMCNEAWIPYPYAPTTQSIIAIKAFQDATAKAFGSFAFVNGDSPRVSLIAFYGTGLAIFPAQAIAAPNARLPSAMPQSVQASQAGVFFRSASSHLELNVPFGGSSRLLTARAIEGWIVVSFATPGETDACYVHLLVLTNEDKPSVSSQFIRPMDHSCTAIHIGEGYIFTSTYEGGVSRCSLRDAIAGNAVWVDLPPLKESCVVLYATPEEKPHLLHMSSGGNLYFDNQLLSDGCTSLWVHSHFVTFTTRQNKLFVRMWHRLLSADTVDEDIWNRDIELGARIASIVYYPLDVRRKAVEAKSIRETKVIVQMPRGNLETFCPRPFAMLSVKEHLSQREYLAAFQLLRKYRIDLNIMTDYSWPLAFHEAEELLKQLGEAENINILLSSLKPGNSLEGAAWFAELRVPERYADIGSDAIPLENKVTALCEKLRGSLKQKGRSHVTSVIGTFVFSTPPQMEDALRFILEERDREGSDAAEVTGASDKSTPVAVEVDLLEEYETVSKPTWELALEHLIFLTQDVNLIFDLALSMYELNLAKLIGVKSRKDPREFMALIASFKELNECERRFRIDLHLKNGRSAIRSGLICIAQGANVAKDLSEYLQKEQAHRTLASVTRSDVSLLAQPDALAFCNNELSRFASTLKGQKTPAACVEAAQIFTEMGEHSSAVECAALAGDIRLVLDLAPKVPFTVAQLGSEGIIAKLVHSLETQHRIEEAAEWMCKIGQAENALDILTSARRWGVAMEIAIANNLAVYIPTWKSDVYTDGKGVLEELAKKQEDFTRYTERLAYLKDNIDMWRENAKREDPHLFRGADDDKVSVISVHTHFSNASRASRQSAKSHHSTASSASRAEKKKMSADRDSVFLESNIKREVKSMLPTTRWLEGVINPLVRILKHYADASSSSLAEEIETAVKNWIGVSEGAQELLTTDLGTLQGVQLPDFILPLDSLHDEIRSVLGEVRCDPVWGH